MYKRSRLSLHGTVTVTREWLSSLWRPFLAPLRVRSPRGARQRVMGGERKRRGFPCGCRRARSPLPGLPGPFRITTNPGTYTCACRLCYAGSSLSECTVLVIFAGKCRLRQTALAVLSWTGTKPFGYFRTSFSSKCLFLLLV